MQYITMFAFNLSTGDCPHAIRGLFTYDWGQAPLRAKKKTCVSGESPAQVGNAFALQDENKKAGGALLSRGRVPHYPRRRGA